MTVLLVGETEDLRHLLKPGRERVAERDGLRAAVSTERNDGPAEARRHDVLFDQALELIIEGANQIARIVRGLEKFQRDGVAGDPELYRAIAHRIGAAPHPRLRVGGIPPGADIAQIERTCRLVVAEQGEHAKGRMETGRAGLRG